MKSVRFEYLTELKLKAAVPLQYFSVRCIPCSTPRQWITSLDFTLFPKTPVWQNHDSFGNLIYSGRYTFPHISFVFGISGTAVTDCTARDTDGFMECYRFPSPLTKPGEAIRKLYESVKETLGRRPYERAMALCDTVNKAVSYLKNSTDTKTTAEQALLQQKGVCQDYAHILISLLRLDGIAARYAAGLFSGEGETHGWVEIWTESGWIGIDPTLGKRADDEYLRISQGRDFADSAIDRGILFGGSTEQEQSVTGFLTICN